MATTRRHRKSAANACPLVLGVDEWIQIGEFPPNTAYGLASVTVATGRRLLERLAQEICDAEERGTPGAQRKAWQEGYSAGIRTYSVENPYPAPEEGT